jgi:hypothetical protein
LTGADDGKKEKTINLELKDEFKKGAFGKITAAVGTSDRGVLRGNYNRFNKKEQFSVLGYANNINETGVNWSDYGEFKGNNSLILTIMEILVLVMAIDSIIWKVII